MPKSKRRAPRPAKRQSSSAARRSAQQRSGQRTQGGFTWLSVIGAAVTVGVVAIAVLIFSQTRGGTSPAATATAPSVPTAAPSLSQRIDGIPCNNENIGYHVHTHLQVVYEVHNVDIPANIGINDNTCAYYLHTHDNSGELHIEAPTYRYFTLGNFFDIWGQPLSSSHVATFSLRNGQHIRTFLNGKIYHGNPRSIELRAHRLIALEIGPPFVQPAGFDFQGD